MICKQGNGTTEKREHMRNGEGTVSIEHFFPKLPAGCRLASVLTLPKGTSIGEHEHNHEAELFYVLAGAALYNDNGLTSMLTQGDCAIVSDGRHSIEGISDEPCRVLAVIITEK